MKNMLVTGGAGFIGANFIHVLLSQDETVRIINLDALTYAGSLNNLKNLPDESRHQFVHGSICDAQLVKKLLRENDIDTIVHFAAESHVDNSIADPAAFIETNVLGTFHLLQAAREKNCRFHHVSTDEVFGELNLDEPAFTENHRYSPNSPYSASKASSDHLVRAFARTYGLPITISHCSNNYGPYQHAEKFIPTVIRSCLQGKSIPIYGNGTNIRDWLYVEDHCLGIIEILRHGKLGETYNLGGNCEMSNLELAKRICSLLNEVHPSSTPYENLLSFVPDRLGHDWRYAMDISKISRELSWNPIESFQSGIVKTINYFKNV